MASGRSQVQTSRAAAVVSTILKVLTVMQISTRVDVWRKNEEHIYLSKFGCATQRCWFLP